MSKYLTVRARQPHSSRARIVGLMRVNYGVHFYLKVLRSLGAKVSFFFLSNE